MKHLIIFLFSTLLINPIYNSQCNLTLTASQPTVPCFGGQVVLTGNGAAQTVSLLNTTFDNGTVGPGWSVSPAGQFNNPCGGSFDGGTHMWMGSSTAAPRKMQTASFDVSCGGQVCFYLKYATQGSSSPCEGPDASGEGVHFEYSANGGAWNNIAYFIPQSTSTLLGWNQYCYNIPAGAQTSNTIFRWYQSGSSGNGYDHWGIDNVSVNAINCNSFYYDWGHINGTGDEGASTTVNLTSNTTYNLTYTDGQGNGCSQSITITLQNATSNFSAASVCLNELTNFNDISTGGGDQVNSWAWNFGDGSTSNLQNPTHTFTSPGNFNVQLNISTVNNCTHSVTIPYNIKNLPPANAGNDVSLDCATTSGTFSATGGNSYTWTTPDGPSSSSSIPVSHTNTQGMYIVTATGANGCNKNDTAFFVIDSISPTASAGIDTLLTCQNTMINLNGTNSSSGANYTYMWTTTNGNITTGANTLSPTINSNGEYTITVTSSINNCTDTEIVEVGIDTIHPASEAGQDSLINCTIPMIQLNGIGSSSGNFSYLWNSTDGHILSGQNSLTPSINSSGTYIITVTDNFNGCNTEDSVFISENFNYPTAFAGEDSIVICNKPIIILNATGSDVGDYSYLWSTDSGSILLGTNSLFPTIDSGGNYIITVTNNTNGCSSTDSVFISEDLTAEVSILLADNTIDTLYITAGDLAPFSWIGDNGTVDWDFGDNNFSNDSINNHTYNLLGIYNATIILVDESGCVAYDSIWIMVDGREIIFPNIFTPNNDGENDVFTFRAEKIKEFNCLIFNRWGKNVYSWNTPVGGWDGRTLAGKESPEGEYFYILKAVDQYGKTIEKKGAIMLMR